MKLSSDHSNNNNTNTTESPSIATLLELLIKQQDQEQEQPLSSSSSVAGTDTAVHSCDSSSHEHVGVSYSSLSSQKVAAAVEYKKMAPKTYPTDKNESSISNNINASMSNGNDNGQHHQSHTQSALVPSPLQNMDIPSAMSTYTARALALDGKPHAVADEMNMNIQHQHHPSAEDLAAFVPEVVDLEDQEEVDDDNHPTARLPLNIHIVAQNPLPSMRVQDSVVYREVYGIPGEVNPTKERIKPCDDDCTQFRSGLGYSGFNLFGGGCLNVNLPTLPAKELAGEYDLLYMNYIRHHIRNGRMKFVTVEHQQTAKGKVSMSAVESVEGNVVQYNINYDNKKMDLPFELVCTDNFCFTETRRTIDQIQFNIEDNDDGHLHPYQQISEGPVWGCISVIEKPIAIGWMPTYCPYARMVRDKTDDDEEDSDEEIDEDENDEILDAEFPYERNKAFVFDSPEEAFALNESYYDASNSWLVSQNLLPSELSMLVRTYMYPPPALIFEKGDIWFSACWNDDDSEDGITWSTIARPRVLAKDEHDQKL